MTDLDEIEAAFRDETELLWLETPTNPLMSIVDIEGASRPRPRARRALCDRQHVCDAVPPAPLDLGADIVSHSLTKYLGGHSDVVGGALLTNDEELDERLGFYQNSVGATPGPFDSFLVLRGTKTLPVRMDRHCENARAIAAWLDDHPDVDRVYYPGLESHPGHEIASEQMDDFGGMLSFELDASLEGSQCSRLEHRGVHARGEPRRRREPD